QIGAEFANIFLRDVNAVILEVLADVAQDVGQLERDAAFLGQLKRFGRLKTKNVDDGEANHARDLIAVAIQLIEGSELLGLEIRADAIDHLIEIFVRNAVALDGI